MGSDQDDPRERASIGSSPDLNRAVYERFLSSDYPEALRLADLVLERNPEDEVARAVRAQCVDAIARGSVPPPPREPSAEDVLGDDDILEEEAVTLADDDVFELEGDLDADTAPFAHVPVMEPTSPTLSLGSRSEAIREVYRLFLASEYAPALERADELLGQGERDPMLASIARECRAVVSSRSSIPELAAPPEMIAHLVEGDVDTRAPGVLGCVNGSMTVEQVASATGMPVEDVLGLLERFVAMGVLTLRPPPPPPPR